MEAVGHGQREVLRLPAELDQLGELFHNMPRECVAFFRVLLSMGTFFSVAILVLTLPTVWYFEHSSSDSTSSSISPSLVNTILWWFLACVVLLQVLQLPLRLRLHARLHIANVEALPRDNIIAELMDLVSSVEWRINKHIGNAGYGLFAAGSFLTSFAHQLSAEHPDSRLFWACAVSLSAIGARILFSFCWFFFSFLYRNEMAQIGVRNGRSATERLITEKVKFYSWPGSQKIAAETAVLTTDVPAPVATSPTSFSTTSATTTAPVSSSRTRASPSFDLMTGTPALIASMRQCSTVLTPLSSSSSSCSSFVPLAAAAAGEEEGEGLEEEEEDHDAEDETNNNNNSTNSQQIHNHSSHQHHHHHHHHRHHHSADAIAVTRMLPIIPSSTSSIPTNILNTSASSPKNISARTIYQYVSSSSSSSASSSSNTGGSHSCEPNRLRVRFRNNWGNTLLAFRAARTGIRKQIQGVTDGLKGGLEDVKRDVVAGIQEINRGIADVKREVSAGIQEMMVMQTTAAVETITSTNSLLLKVADTFQSVVTSHHHHHHHHHHQYTKSEGDNNSKNINRLMAKQAAAEAVAIADAKLQMLAPLASRFKESMHAGGANGGEKKVANHNNNDNNSSSRNRVRGGLFHPHQFSSSSSGGCGCSGSGSSSSSSSNSNNLSFAMRGRTRTSSFTNDKLFGTTTTSTSSANCSVSSNTVKISSRKTTATSSSSLSSETIASALPASEATTGSSNQASSSSSSSSSSVQQPEGIQNENNEVCCAVCLGALQEGDKVAQLPCATSHIFHTDCIIPWLRMNKKCPLCSQDIDEPFMYKPQQQQAEVVA